MRVFVSLVMIAAAHAFCPAPRTTASSTTSTTALDATTTYSRRQVVGGIAAAAASLALPIAPAFAAVETLPNGVTYQIDKKGAGPAPDIGELCAIRFKASVQDGKLIDDIFDTPEPYYTRVGSGGMLKGVEGALPYMHVGDRWTLTIPPALAFGGKGRPASAGKPRIPSDATILFEVEMVGLPGKEPELIELIGDD